MGLDVIFGELRSDHASVDMGDGNYVESDVFFAAQLRRASNVVLAVTAEVTPPPLFLTNAWAAGDISTDKDSDGILRRAKAFHDRIGNGTRPFGRLRKIQNMAWTCDGRGSSQHQMLCSLVAGGSHQGAAG